MLVVLILQIAKFSSIYMRQLSTIRSIVLSVILMNAVAPPLMKPHYMMDCGKPVRGSMVSNGREPKSCLG